MSALALVAVAPSSSAFAAGGPPNGQGSGPNAIYKGKPTILTPEQRAAIQQKNDRFNQWLATQRQGQLAPSSITPDCVIGPNGQCYVVYQVSGGGEYVVEPADEPNWCAPGAATNVYLHWNYSAVENHGAVTVPRDPWFGGGNATYSGGQGWMAWFADDIYYLNGSTYRYGVMDQPFYSAGANEYVVANALDSLTSNYYHVVKTTSTADLVGKTKYDITVDGRPLDYFANAQYLPSWSGVNGQLNHSIEVYGMTQTVGTPDYHSDIIEYVDSINNSADHRGTPGDWGLNQYNMWNLALMTSAATGDITW